MTGVGRVDRNGAVIRYVAAVAVVVAGAAIAVHRFPAASTGPTTVISKLASPRHNPDGGAWLRGALLAAMLMLWPVAGHLVVAGDRRAADTRAEAHRHG